MQEKCTSGKFVLKKVYSMCTNVANVVTISLEDDKDMDCVICPYDGSVTYFF